MKTLTEKDQDIILRKTLKHLRLEYDRTFFIAIITGDTHPEDAIPIIHKSNTFYVRIQYGDFVCIYVK